MAADVQPENVSRQTEHVACPSCGGEMAFSPEAGALVCPYCGYQKEIEKTAEIPRHDYDTAIREDAYTGSSEQWGEGTVVFRCRNCGATLTVGDRTTAQVCAFCGSPMVADEAGGSPATPPDAVLPFHITREQALQSFKKWVKKRFFSPRKLRTQNHMQRLQGLYVPHFTFDCTTASDYTAEAGTHYYMTETVSDGHGGTTTQEVQHTRWHPVSGSYADRFRDELVNASANIDQKLVRLQFNLGSIVPYSRDYILGFVAENNSISRDDCWGQAKRNISSKLNERITREINADEVRGLQVDTQYADVRFRSILLPVWSSVYLYKGKSYKFMINGQSGEVKGQAPLSAPRILLTALLGLGIPVLLYHFFGLVPAVVALIIAIIVVSVLAS